MKGTLGCQLVSVVVGQLQSRRVFGRKGNVTAMVTVFHVRTCQLLVHVNYNTIVTVSLGYLSQCDGEGEFKFPSSYHCTYARFWSSHPWIRDEHRTLSELSIVYTLVRENKYKQVKSGLGVILSPSLNIMYTRPHVDMSSNLLVGVKGILIIRHTALGGMKCNCEPIGKTVHTSVTAGTVKQRIAGPC